MPMLRFKSLPKESLLIVALFCSALLIRLGHYFVRGVQPAADTLFYLENAAKIAAAGTPLTLKTEGIYFYYWLYPSLLALLGSNKEIIVVVQIILQALAAVLIYLIGKKVFSQKAGLASALLFALSFEIFQWDLYVLTDSLFIFALVAAFYVALITRETKTIGPKLILALFLLVILMLRPTFLPFLAPLGLYFAAGWSKKIRWATIGLAVLFALGTAFYLLNFGSQKQFGVASSLRLYQTQFLDGIVVHDRPIYTLPLNWQSGFNWQNTFNFLTIFGRRLIAFWSIFTPDFAIGHKLLNILSLLPLYIFGLIAILRSKIRSPHFFFVLNLIICYWIFQSLTMIDYDWRYRAPVMPFLILLAGEGIAMAMSKKTMRSDV